MGAWVLINGTWYKSSADFVAQLQRAQTDILAGIRFGHGKFSGKARVS
jgi:hypothetical protein